MAARLGEAAEAIIALYDADALLSKEPFREPYAGRPGVRDYVTRVFAEEDDPRVHVADPIVDGDRAAVLWWASLREEDADSLEPEHRRACVSAASRVTILVRSRWTTVSSRHADVPIRPIADRVFELFPRTKHLVTAVSVFNCEARISHLDRHHMNLMYF